MGPAPLARPLPLALKAARAGRIVGGPHAGRGAS